MNEDQAAKGGGRQRRRRKKHLKEMGKLQVKQAVHSLNVTINNKLAWGGKLALLFPQRSTWIVNVTWENVGPSWAKKHSFLPGVAVQQDTQLLPSTSTLQQYPRTYRTTRERLLLWFPEAMSGEGFPMHWSLSTGLRDLSANTARLVLPRQSKTDISMLPVAAPVMMSTHQVAELASPNQLFFN